MNSIEQQNRNLIHYLIQKNQTQLTDIHIKQSELKHLKKTLDLMQTEITRLSNQDVKNNRTVIDKIKSFFGLVFL